MGGWALAVPVPLLLMWAPNWTWVIVANALLGVSQGLTWSMTVNMKVDLAGPRQRGLALGLNEAAGYVSVAAAAFLTGLIADRYGLRPEPFYMGIGFAAAGLALSVLLVRDTGPFVAHEHASDSRPASRPSLRRSFAEVTWRRPHMFGASQAGLVNTLNDALAWGIFPLFFASRGLEIDRIAMLAATYPLVWGLLQLVTGWSSDVVGRKPIIVAGMLLQAAAIFFVGVSDGFAGWFVAVALLGAGTALVYPTLLAAVSDESAPRERATSLGVYRFWRDGGAVVGALSAGALADWFGFQVAIQAIAAVTAASGILAASTLRSKTHSPSLEAEVSS